MAVQNLVADKVDPTKQLRTELAALAASQTATLVIERSGDQTTVPIGVIAGAGAALPATAARIGQLYWLNGVGIYRALDLVGNWLLIEGTAPTTMAANSIRANPTTAIANGIDLDVAADRIVGRNATGNVAALTPAQARQILRRAKHTLVFAASQNWDLANGLFQEVTVTSNFTLNFPANVTEGDSAFLYIRQNATGGRTITWNASFRFAGGTAPTLSTAANAVDRVEFFFHSATQATVTITRDIR
jgi:hypothetical protein